MKLGVSSGLRGAPLGEALDAVAKLGTKRAFVGQAVVDGLTAQGIRASSHRSGVEVANIYLGGKDMLNPALREPAEIDEGLRRLEVALQLAQDIGCRALTVSGAHHGYTLNLESRGARRFDEVVDCWRRAAPLLEQYRVYLCLESGIHTTIYSPELYRDLFERVDCEYLGITMDVVNMLSAEDYYDQHPKMDRLFDLCQGRVQVAHLKDITHEAKLHTHLSEAAPGEGNLDWDYMLPLIDRALPDWGIAFIEHTPYEKLAASIEHVRAKAAACGVTVE